MSRYDIAVIGMGCVVPNAHNIREYWDNIQSGDTYFMEMPEDLWHLRCYYNPDKSQSDKSYTMVGSFVRDFKFDPLKYRIPPNNMRGIDPAQLMTIVATEEALSDAGIPARDPRLTEAMAIIGASGVDAFAHSSAFLQRHTFLKHMKPTLERHGVSAEAYDRLYQQMTDALDARGHIWAPSVAAVGAIPSSLSNRICQVFGIRGMNMTVDAACASSFVAVDTACQALMAGDTRIAIAGGTDLGTNPSIYIGFSRVDGLSTKGMSNPFDHSADGLVIGEGVGMVVLKRLEDALEDGDRIRAVIRSIGSSSDGAGQAIYAPSVEGRAKALRAALQRAQTSVDDVQYIEAHATSTVVGDANEYDAISTVYGSRRNPVPIRLGSVKQQIGHLKAAAGVVGLIKAVLAMNNGMFPHHPRFEKLTPHATKVTDALLIPTRPEKWEPLPDGMRVAAVTSSGFGGVNYHLILEEGQTYRRPGPRKVPDRRMAVVGVACKMAGAVNPDQFWNNIAAGRDTFTRVTDPSLLGWQNNFETGPANEIINTHVVSKMDDFPINLLKHKIFPKAVSQISPTQFLALETSDELLENYGLEYKEPKNVGVSIGSMHDDYFPQTFYPMMLDEYVDVVRSLPVAQQIDRAVLDDALQEAKRLGQEAYPNVSEHTLPGWMTNVTAGRIANKLNCQGPNFTVDSACSSGIAAMVPAMYQLMYGTVDMMISGGLNRQFSDTFTSGVCALGALAKEEARPFDATGTGYLIGEGSVFFLLKRYADAKRDGDDIFGVVHALGGASEADSRSMVAPTQESLERAIRHGLRQTPVDPCRIALSETHGSANKLSDIIEARAIAEVLRTGCENAPPVYISAVKSHVGHLYGGSGPASILSVFLSLRHRQVPGIRHLKNIRPEITDVLHRALPVKETTRLPQDAAWGAVTSLGLGGANYFVVLGIDADEPAAASGPDGGEKGTAFVGRQVTRAGDADADDVFICLVEKQEDFAGAIGRALSQDVIPNLISEGKDAKLRLTVAFDSQTTLASRLRQTLKMLEGGHSLRPLETQGVFAAPVADRSRLAFCLPGQGVHYISMARFLYDSEPVFREVVDAVHTQAMETFQFDLIGHIYGDEDDAQIAKNLGTLVGAQTSLYAIEVALARLLISRNIVPDVLIGHSFGEISALTIAGVWSVADGYKAVIGRIRAAETIREAAGPQLAMASIVCTDEQRDALLKVAGDNVVLTNINAPGRFIFGGVKADIVRCVELAESFGVDAQLLPIGSAFHSKYMEPAREPFRKWIRKIPCSAPTIPIMSTITGDYVKTDGFSADYLAEHLSSQLVTQLNLPREINRLYEEGVRHYLEVGPKWAMTKMVEAILAGRDFRATHTLHPKVGDVESFRRARAFLVATGHMSSAAERADLPGMFAPDFLEYMQKREPAVLALIEEVYRRYVANLIEVGMGRPSPARPSVAMPAAAPRPLASAVSPAVPAEPAAPAVSTSAKSSGGGDVAVWKTRLREKLVKTTGYPAEMLEDDLDLEADLGVDSVQRAEIWVALISEYGLSQDIRPEGPRTISNLAATLAAAGADTGKKSDGGAPVALTETAVAPSASATPGPVAISPLPQPGDEKACHLYAAGVDFLDDSRMKPVTCHHVLLITGENSAFAGRLKRRLAKREIEVTTLRERALGTMPDEEIAALLARTDTLLYAVHETLAEVAADGAAMQAAVDTQTEALYRVFRRLIPALQTAEKRIIFPVSMDGRFGIRGVTTSRLGAFPCGFARCLDKELAACRVQIIDAGDMDWADAVDANIAWMAPAMEIGMTAAGRVTPVLSEVAPAPSHSAPLSKGDLVLVTGGARGIVFECVAALARYTGCRLVLTGRTEAEEGNPTWLATSPADADAVFRKMEIDMVKQEGKKLPEAKKIAANRRARWEVNRNMQRLRAAGIDVTYERCDVGNRDELAALVRRISSRAPIVGVVHGSGVQKSNLITELPDRAIELTLKTKLTPVFTLLDELDWSRVKLFSAFGSIAGLFGNAGQSDYALANDMLAWLVKNLAAAHPGLRAQTVEWTAWVGTGMVSEQEGKRFAEAGLVPLTVDTGVPLYMHGISGCTDQRVAAFNAAAAFAGGRPFTVHPVSAQPRARLLDRNPDKGRILASFSLLTDAYINQHLVNLEPVIPGTFVTELFAEALQGSDLAPSRIHFRRPMQLRGDELQVEVVRDGDAMLLVPAERPDLPPKALSNLSYSSCRLVPRASLGAADWKIGKKELKQLAQQSMERSASFYDLLDRKFFRALKTGPVFRGVRATLEDGDMFYSTVTLTSAAQAALAVPGEFVFNPVLADMAVQVAAAWVMLRHDVMEIPFEIGTLNAAGPLTGEDAVVICHKNRIADDESSMDVVVRNMDGSLVMTMTDLVLKAILRGDGQ